MPSEQIIVVEVVEALTQIAVVHVGNPGPRGPAGIGSSPEIENFLADDWTDDPDNEGLSRLVLDLDTYCFSIWEVVGSTETLRTDTLLITRELVDGSVKLVIRNGSDDTFAGFLAYFPQGV